jgi:hypothetical protein
MARFDPLRIRCSRCRRDPPVGAFSPRCLACSGARFDLEIERSSWGVDAQELAELLALGSQTVWGACTALALDFDGSIEPVWRTHSVLTLSGLTGDEVREFLQAPVPERSRLYGEWKRREREDRLLPEERVCRRCRIIFRAWKNAWNGAGFCSRACHRAASAKVPRA